ncbi:MAG: energy transducer TonB [Prevotella sp.]|nr:energy transducer TonB [Prevotella sp.]
MEEKKSYAADLERKRSTRFLLGLVVALVLFIVAMEFKYSAIGFKTDDMLLEELAQEMEMMPAMEQKDMIVMPPEEKTEPKVIEKVNPVDESLVKQMPDRMVENQPLLTEGDAENNVVDDETPNVAPVAIDEDDNPLHFRVVERLPEFPGGTVALMKWLSQQLKYPPVAQRQKIQGTVVVSFIVNKDGTTSDAHIMHSSARPMLDAEALRVVRMMPKWTPGEDHGKPCRTLFAIPIEFRL